MRLESLLLLALVWTPLPAAVMQDPVSFIEFDVPDGVKTKETWLNANHASGYATVYPLAERNANVVVSSMVREGDLAGPEEKVREIIKKGFRPTTSLLHEEFRDCGERRYEVRQYVEKTDKEPNYFTQYTTFYDNFCIMINFSTSYSQAVLLEDWDAIVSKIRYPAGSLDDRHPLGRIPATLIKTQTAAGTFSCTIIKTPEGGKLRWTFLPHGAAAYAYAATVNRTLNEAEYARLQTFIETDPRLQKNKASGRAATLDEGIVISLRPNGYLSQDHINYDLDPGVDDELTAEIKAMLGFDDFLRIADKSAQ